jgi:hypothetical protein
VHAVGEHELCLVVFQIERIELLHADPLLRLRPPIESSLAADRIDRGEGGGRAGPVLWLSDYDRGEGVESGRLGTERRVGQEDAGEGLGDRDEGESAQGHRARARRRRRADPVVGARRDADSPGMREQGASLQNAATLAATAGAGIVPLGSAFCRCTSICSYCWRQSKSSSSTILHPKGSRPPLEFELLASSMMQRGLLRVVCFFFQITAARFQVVAYHFTKGNMVISSGY